MKSYGQFCAVARALELLGERWTMLVVRELLCGGSTFGDLMRGLPRISRTMLSARLRELTDGGVIVKREGGYQLTAAGRELGGVVRELGTWGQRWLPRESPPSGDALDVDALFWDMHRRVDRAKLPRQPVVVRLEVEGLRRARPRWLLLRQSETSLCTHNPGLVESLVLRADAGGLVARRFQLPRGAAAWAAARRAGAAGARLAELVRALSVRGRLDDGAEGDHRHPQIGDEPGQVGEIEHQERIGSVILEYLVTR
jgi:DNA-binding HxlR family transcriptional regulator